MKHILKKHTIKVTNNINVIYSANKKIITFVNSICQKSLKLNVQIFLNKSKKIIKVSQLPFSKNSIDKQKRIYFIKGTETAIIKQIMLELSTTFYKKLIFIGVGYRVFNINNFDNSMLMFKLGYSHFFYFRVTKNIKTFNSKSIKLFFFSKNYQNLTQIVSLIRSFKKPEPYNGKGLLYENEKVQLKKPKNF